MREANLVIGLRSRTLLEATYLKKPTIIVGRSYWDTLGPLLKLKNKVQLKKLILSKKVKWYGNLAASKYAYFWLTHGKPIKYVSVCIYGVLVKKLSDLSTFLIKKKS